MPKRKMLRPIPDGWAGHRWTAILLDRMEMELMLIGRRFGLDEAKRAKHSVQVLRSKLDDLAGEDSPYYGD